MRKKTKEQFAAVLRVPDEVGEATTLLGKDVARWVRWGYDLRVKREPQPLEVGKIGALLNKPLADRDVEELAKILEDRYLAAALYAASYGGAQRPDWLMPLGGLWDKMTDVSLDEGLMGHLSIRLLEGRACAFNLMDGLELPEQQKERGRQWVWLDFEEPAIGNEIFVKSMTEKRERVLEVVRGTSGRLDTWRDKHDMLEAWFNDIAFMGENTAEIRYAIDEMSGPRLTATIERGASSAAIDFMSNWVIKEIDQEENHDWGYDRVSLVLDAIWKLGWRPNAALLNEWIERVHEWESHEDEESDEYDEAEEGFVSRVAEHVIPGWRERRRSEWAARGLEEYEEDEDME